MKNIKKHFLILSIIFVLILVWGILLKMNQLHIIERDFNMNIKLSNYERFIYYPLNPFELRFSKITVVFNVISFIPFGFLISVLFNKFKILKVLGISLGLTLIFEISQIFTAIGAFSTNDLMCNTFGGVIGCLIFLLCEAIIKKVKNQTVKYNLIKTFIIVCYVVFIPVAIFGIVNTIINIDFYISLYN